MRNQNAYLTDRAAEVQRMQRWDAFCQSGSIADYLQYRSCTERSGGTGIADTSDRPRTGDPGDTRA